MSDRSRWEKPLTAAQRDRLPPPPLPGGFWPRLVSWLDGAAGGVQRGIIVHREQTDAGGYRGNTRAHNPKGSGAVGNGP